MNLQLCAWTLAEGVDPEWSAAAQLLPTRLLPVVYQLAGFDVSRALDSPGPRVLGELCPDSLRLTLEVQEGRLAELEEEPCAGAEPEAALRVHPGPDFLERLIEAINDLTWAPGRLRTPPEARRAVLREAAVVIPARGSDELRALCRDFAAIEAETELAALPEGPLDNLARAQGGELAFAIAEEDAAATAFLGLALGDFGLAERAYLVIRDARLLNPRLRARLAVMLGQGRYDRGQLTGYRKLLEQAQGIAPDDIVVRRHLATAALVDGDIPRAIDLWAELVKVDPEQARFRFGLARALMAAERSAEAKEAFTIAASLAQGAGEGALRDAILHAFCEHLITAGQSEELMVLAPRFSRAFAASAELGVSLATAMIIQSRYSMAEAVLQRALERDASQAGAWALLAKARLARGKTRPAVEAARRARALEPEQELWAIGLAEALVEDRQHDEAAALFKELKEASEEGTVRSAVYMVLVAWSCESKDPDKAETLFRNACSAFPDAHFARSEYGVCLTGRGRLEEAALLLAPFLDTHPEYRRGLENLQTALLMLMQRHEDGPGDPGIERWKTLLRRVNVELGGLNKGLDETRI